MKIKIQVPDGKIITRKAHPEWIGNFLVLWVWYKGKAYIVNEGDEYLSEYPKVFTLVQEVER